MSENSQKKVGPQKSKFKLPDIYIVLSIFILVVAILTYIVPAGEYQRETVQTAEGSHLIVVPNSYHKITPTPAGFMDIISSVPSGMKRASGIVFLTFLVGACMGLIKRAGLIDLGVQSLSKAVGNKEFLVTPILLGVFTAVAAFIGVPELSLAYVPVLIPLFYRLGYDGMTAVAVGMLGPCVGFTFGLTIPGSIGVGQDIAQLPIFSGSGFRAVVLIIVWVITVLYVMWYARKVKINPKESLSLESDESFREELAHQQQEEKVFTKKQSWAGISCLIMFPLVIALILYKHLGFEEIGGLFLIVGIIAAAISGMGPQKICDGINGGMHDMMVPALLCGIASAIAVVMDGGHITDTIVFWLNQILETIPREWTTIAIYIEQSIFNFLIPGSTALTVLTMPVLSPLGSLLDLSQQAIVSANAWGGQITDVFFPTSGFFVATLLIGRIEFMRWIRFYTPLLLAYYVVGSVALYLMQMYSISW